MDFYFFVILIERIGQLLYDGLFRNLEADVSVAQGGDADRVSSARHACALACWQWTGACSVQSSDVRRCSPVGPQRQKWACAVTLTRSHVHVLLPAGTGVSRAAMSGFIASFKSLDFYRSVQPSSATRSPRALPAAHLPPVQGAANEHMGENDIMFSFLRPFVSSRPHSFSCCVSGS